MMMIQWCDMIWYVMVWYDIKDMSIGDMESWNKIWHVKLSSRKREKEYTITFFF